MKSDILYFAKILILFMFKQTLGFTLEQALRDFTITNFTNTSDYSVYSSENQINQLNYFTSNNKLVLGYLITEQLKVKISEKIYSAFGVNFYLYVKKDQMEKYLSKNYYATFKFNMDKTVEYSLDYLFNKNLINNVIMLENDYLYKVNISLTYQNTNNINYLPIMLSISSNSSIEWAISDLYLFKVSCNSKCSVCNLSSCISCNADASFIQGENICTCNNSLGKWDYSNIDQPINCNGRYLPYYYENFSNYYLNTSWNYNGNQITPYDLNIKCLN